tara:strand:+ start:159 stop:761 length:603 start_codon:yes stop_codon:yes gene_type:complete
MTKSEKKEKEDLVTENEKQKPELKNKEQSEESLENKLKSVEEKLLRTLAEMENQRRRFEKEREEAFEFGGFNFAKESLALLDNIDRATTSFKNDENLKKNKDLEKILDGIEIVKKDLITIFNKNGVEVMECINKKFDPNFHQAMLEIEDNIKEPGTVVQEIQKGYMMKSRLLRPALVGVTKKSEKNQKNITKETKKDEKK